MWSKRSMSECLLRKYDHVAYERLVKIGNNVEVWGEELDLERGE